MADAKPTDDRTPLGIIERLGRLGFRFNFTCGPHGARAESHWTVTGQFPSGQEVFDCPSVAKSFSHACELAVIRVDKVGLIEDLQHAVVVSMIASALIADIEDAGD